MKFFFSFQWGADYSRVIRPPTGLKNAADPVDLGFKPHGLKWKGKNAILNQQRVTRQKKDCSENLTASQPSVQLSQTSSSKPTKVYTKSDLKVMISC